MRVRGGGLGCVGDSVVCIDDMVGVVVIDDVDRGDCVVGSVDVIATGGVHVVGVVAAVCFVDDGDGVGGCGVVYVGAGVDMVVGVAVDVVVGVAGGVVVCCSVAVVVNVVGCFVVAVVFIVCVIDGVAGVDDAVVVVNVGGVGAVRDVGVW